MFDYDTNDIDPDYELALPGCPVRCYKCEEVFDSTHECSNCGECPECCVCHEVHEVLELIGDKDYWTEYEISKNERQTKWS